jgi:GAF domain-containing protein
MSCRKAGESFMKDQAKIAEYLDKIESLEKKLRRREELDLLKQQLLDQTDPRILIDVVAEAAARLINAETVAIPILTPDNLHVRYEHAWGKHKDIFLGLSIPVEKAGLCGWVLENRKAIFTNRLMDDPRVLRETAAALGINAAALAPLIAKGRIIGGLSAFNRADGGEFTEEDLSDLTGLANYAALIIENTNLLSELAREKLKLDAIFEGVNDGIIFISKSHKTKNKK